MNRKNNRLESALLERVGENPQGEEERGEKKKTGFRKGREKRKL